VWIELQTARVYSAIRKVLFFKQQSPLKMIYIKLQRLRRANLIP